MSSQCLKLRQNGFLSIFLHRSMWVLRCSQLCGLVFLSSGVWRCAMKLSVPDVSKESNAFIFECSEVSRGLESTTFLQKFARSTLTQKETSWSLKYKLRHWKRRSMNHIMQEILVLPPCSPQAFCSTLISVNAVEHYFLFMVDWPLTACLISQTAAYKSRSHWPRGLSCRSAAAPLLVLRDRIPPESWMSFSCDCCALSGTGLCDGPITRPEESYQAWCF